MNNLPVFYSLRHTSLSKQRIYEEGSTTSDLSDNHRRSNYNNYDAAAISHVGERAHLHHPTNADGCNEIGKTASKDCEDTQSNPSQWTLYTEGQTWPKLSNSANRCYHYGIDDSKNGKNHTSMIQKAGYGIIRLDVENLCDNQDGCEAVGNLANVRILVEKDVGKDVLTVWSAICIVAKDDEEQGTKTDANDHRNTIP